MEIKAYHYAHHKEVAIEKSPSTRGLNIFTTFISPADFPYDTVGEPIAGLNLQIRGPSTPSSPPVGSLNQATAYESPQSCATTCGGFGSSPFSISGNMIIKKKSL